MFFSGFIFIEQTIGNEYGIIIAQAEYKCRNNDIDKIEFDSEYSHQPQNPDPGNEHWNKS